MVLQLSGLLVGVAKLPDNAMLLLLLLLLTLLSAAIQEQHGAPCFNINFVALPRLHPTQLANLTKACSASNRCSVQSCNKKNACDKKNACHKKNACDKKKHASKCCRAPAFMVPETS